jgi:hypothetical protein
VSAPGVLCQPGLPRRTRVRLWLTRQVDGLAVWLCRRDRVRLAWLTWKAAGLL